MATDYLCVLCRATGHKTAECPSWDEIPGHDSGPKDLQWSDEIVLRSAARDANEVCSRCTALDIVGLLKTDARIDLGPSKSDHFDRWDDKLYHRPLGPLRDMVLNASCPVCRLIFRVFPRDGDRAPETDFHLRPMRTCHRFGNIDDPRLQGDGQAEYAVYVAVESQDHVAGVLARNLGDNHGIVKDLTYYGFALSNKTPAAGQAALSARKLGDIVDFGLVRSWFENCEAKHGVHCDGTWNDVLLDANMIDVSTREVVPCPPECKYIALSYVWGGIGPEEGALAMGTLPKTIEDSITVTKELGLRYLWVDALCVDQEPTPQQAQQLAMMDRIYYAAWATIIAVSSQNSDSGLYGVRPETKRLPQGCEVVGDHEILTLPPVADQVLETSKYQTRAWTLQEGLFSHRRIMFSEHEVNFWCNAAKLSESIDNTMDPLGTMESYASADDISFFSDTSGAVAHTNQAYRLSTVEEAWRGALEVYTARSMTSDYDSINAFLGIQSHMERCIADPVDSSFVWGLPLRHFPQSLRWYHKGKGKHRRREDFPSWSWAGWEGAVTYSGSLDLMNDAIQSRYVSRRDVGIDMVAKFLDIEGQVLMLQAWMVKLEIRAEPFTEAYIPETDTLLGVIKEGSFSHSVNVPPGVYQFLVVERMRYQVAEGRPFRDEVYMLLLDWEDGIAMRRTKVRLFTEFGHQLEQASPVLTEVKLK